MYINPFLAGCLSTIFAELVIMTIYAIYTSKKTKK